MTTNSPFGTVLVDHMTIARWRDGMWDTPKLGPLESLSLHPAAHVLHYGSACFEGLKAHRGVDDVVRIFRIDAHVERLQESAKVLALPIPTADMLTDMIVQVVGASRADVPHAPGSLYIRPTLIGTEENIGAASRPSQEATLFVLASPVGDYFAGGTRPLSLAIETERPRTTPQFGKVKAGANYAMALTPTMRAAQDLGVDQILFAPNGDVQETGASNILLLDGERVITPALNESFLHGITRDSLLRLASDLGYRVEQRPVTVDEVLAWAAKPDGEAALSGTAAVLAGVGELVHQGHRITVGSGDVGHHTTALRQALTDVHAATRPDPHHWLTAVQ
jgi:branched-chain amino acid aminotransferase